MKKLNLSLLVVFLLLISFGGCGKKGALNSAQFANLPGQAQMLASLNLEKFFTIPEIGVLIEKEAQNKPDQERALQIYRKFKDRSSRFSFALYSGKEKSGEIMIAALNVSYARQEILDLLREEKTDYSSADIKGLDAIEISDSKDNSRQLLVLFKDQILMLDRKHLDFYLQARRSGGKVLESPALRDSLKRVSPEKLFFLVGGNMEQLAQQAPTLPGPKPKAAFAEIDFQKNSFVGKISITAKDENEAKNSVNLINGLKSLIAMSMAEKNPEAAAIIGKINIGAEGADLKIDFQVTLDELKKLSKLK